MNCPECGKKAEADFVDIGVGSQQISPYYCPDCGWTQGSSEKVCSVHGENCPGDDGGFFIDGNHPDDMFSLGPEPKKGKK